MSDCFEQSRSNYVRVKDKVAFQAFLGRFDGIVEMIENKKGRVGFVAPEGLPQTNMPEGDDNGDEDFDFIDEVAGHLADSEVMIVMGSGSDGVKYIVGYAIAINNRKERREVDLDDIYGLAEQLMKKPKCITRMEY